MKLSATTRIPWQRQLLDFLLLTAGCSIGVKLLGNISGLKMSVSSLRFEFFLVLFAYGYFWMLLRDTKFRFFVAAIPLVLIYCLFDIHYMAYGILFRLIEYRELPELLDILPLSAVITAAGVVLLPLLLYMVFVDYRNHKKIGSAVAIAILVGLSLQRYPQVYLFFFDTFARPVEDSSEVRNVRRNGRISMMFYHEAKRVIAVGTTTEFRDRQQYDSDTKSLANYIGENGSGRNVHFIVMEGLLDPTLLKGVKFSRDPTHPDFSSQFGESRGFSVSPVFGGRTAQAEFELLCGVPAFMHLDSVEFNVFTGTPSYCLPGLLSMVGYTTAATHAGKPSYFNRIPAYTGVGFEEIYFPIEFAHDSNTYLATGDISEEKHMFDGDLLEQNLQFVADHLTDRPETPIFNYVLGVYGHTPHLLDEKKRPRLISITTESGTTGELLDRAINQFYYRTRALAQYVRELVALDPESIIIIVSDHLPTLELGVATYAELGYLGPECRNCASGKEIFHNRIYMIDNGQAVRLGTMHHYDIPNLVKSSLTGGDYCDQYDCALKDSDYHDKYMRILAHAME